MTDQGKTRRDLVRPGLARFYPIVPDVAWLARIAPLGIGTVQLRLKDAEGREVRRQVGEALTICAAHGVQLIVNDYWQDALELGADYVHLGQEDLAGADVAALKRAGVRLGISTHDEAELAVALAVQPVYVALGPIYETKLKAMAWAPQGLERLGVWRAAIAEYAQTMGSAEGPALVAIGGLTPQRAAGAYKAGAQSLAVITDFLTHAEPEQRIAEWVALSQNGD